MISIWKIFIFSMLFQRNYCDYSDQQKRQFYNYQINPSFFNSDQSPDTYHSEKYNYNAPESFKIQKPMHCLRQETVPHQGIIDTTWLQTPRLFYLTMSSLWGYSELARIHLGRPAKSELELESMCSAQFFRNESIYYSGYGTQFQSRCVKTPEDTGIVCVNTVGDPRTATSRYSPFRYYVIQTDGHSYALFYRCIRKRYADYALLSTRPVIDSKIANRALRKVVQMGFPEDEVRFLTCKP